MQNSDYSIGGWLILIILGGIVGALGQGVRLVIGMKKLNDAASSQSTTTNRVALKDLIVVSKILISFAIGAIAGALAAAFTLTPDTKISSEHIAGLAAAGYAGADFIEGFMSRISGTNTNKN